jgi:hypothetical protein
MVLEAELRAGADAHHGAGQARLSAALSADVLRAAAEPFGEVSPEALAGALDVQVDVGTLEVPRAEFDLQVPGILTGSGSFSLRREEGWALEGENRFALDLDALADALPPAGAGPLRSLRLGGRLFGFGELGGRFPGGHVWTGGQLFGSGIVLGAEGDLPAPPGAGREARPVRACVDGLTFWLVHATDVFGGGGLGGIGAARLSGGVESLGLEAPGIAAFEGTRLSGGLAAEAPLPVPDAFAVRGGFSVDAARVSAPGLGEVSVPLEVGFATAGRDLTDARDAQIEVEQLSGAVGEIVPGFRVAGTATGWGGRGLEVRGGAVADVGRVVDLLGGLDEAVRALVGEVKGEGAAAIDVEIDGRLPGGSGGSAAVLADASMSLHGAALERPGLAASAGRTDASATLALIAESRFIPQDVRIDAGAELYDLRCALGTGDGDAAERSTLAFARGEVELAGELGLAGVSARVRSRFDDLTVGLPAAGQEPPLAFGPFSFLAAGRLEADPLSGDFDVSDLSLAVPGALEVSAPSVAVRGYGADSVEGRLELAGADLRALLGLATDALPEERTAAWPELAGRLRLTADLGGALPLAEEFVCALETGGSPPALEIFPLEAFYRKRAPLSLEGDWSLEGATLRWGALAGPALAASDVSAGGQFRLAEGDAEGQLSVTVPALQIGALPLPLADLRLAAGFGVSRFNELAVDEFRFTGLGGTVQVDGSLRGSGIGRFQAPPLPADLLRTLDLELKCRGKVGLGGLRLAEGLAASGEVGWDLAMELRGGERLAARTRPRFEGCSLALGDLLAVRGLNGRFDFSKELRIEAARDVAPSALSQTLIAPEPQPAPAGLRGAVPEFATAADELAARPERLTVDSITALGVEVVRDAGLELEVEGGAVSVPRFYLRPLGGSLVGRGALVPGAAGREVHVQGELAGVDFRLLLPPALREFRGDSRANGSFRLDARLAGAGPGREGASLMKDVGASIDVTYVGAGALDRILLALDPRGGNPGIVRIRRALKLATPKRAAASLHRGFVEAHVELQGLASGLVSEYSIPRFSIVPLLEAEVVERHLQRAAPAFVLLDLLDAERLELTPEGSVRLR